MKKSKPPEAALARLQAALTSDSPTDTTSPAETGARAFLRGDAASAALASLDPDTATALVAVLVERADVDRLRTLESLRDTPHVARPAGRGLHLLRTRGVVVADAKAQTSEWRVAAEPLPEGRLGLDFMYDLQWLTAFRHDDAGDGVALIATIDGEGALRSIDAVRASRGRYRELALSVAPRDAFSIDVGADDAFRRLLESAEVREQLGHPFLEAASVLKKLSPLRTHTSAQRPATLSTPLSFDRDAFATFAERPELRTWIPDEATVRGFIEAIKEAQTSLVAIDNRQIAGQIQTVVARTAGAYFSARRMKTHARRFNDLALEFGRRKESEAQSTATSLCDALAADGLDVTTHPYTLWFFGRFVPAITAEHPARIARGAEPNGQEAQQVSADADPRFAAPHGRIILP